MILLNFSHPITDSQKAQIEVLVGQPISRTIGELAKFDVAVPFAKQVRDLLDRVELSAEQWQTTSFVLNLPGFAPAAAIMLADLHGRTGHFPAIMRIRAVDDGPVSRYDVAEIVNLQTIRNQRRELR